MKSIRTEGCHVVLLREFVGTACCTYGQCLRVSPCSSVHSIIPVFSERDTVVNTTIPNNSGLFCWGIDPRLAQSPLRFNAWWRHQMETFLALLAICAGNSPVTVEFPAQRPVTRAFGVSLIWAWINGWISNREAGDLRLYRAHHDVTVMAVLGNIGFTSLIT